VPWECCLDCSKVVPILSETDMLCFHSTCLMLTCCSLLQFVFNFKKLVYSFDAKHLQKFFRAPFPVEFLHCKRVGHSASAVRQVTPLDQGVPPSTIPHEAVYFRNASHLRCYPKGKGWVYRSFTASSWKSNSWFWVFTQTHIPDLLILQMFLETQNLQAAVIIKPKNHPTLL